MVKFISYNGKWPCLCCGTLVIEVNEKRYELKNILVSGGNISFDSDWNPSITFGKWELNMDHLPTDLHKYAKEITDVVNNNVEFGCCGGCI